MPKIAVQSVASVAITKLIELQHLKNGISELKSTAKNGRAESNKYVKIPRTRRNKGLSTEDSCCRISAESHESIHAKINKAKEVVKRIASLMQMYQTLLTRTKRSKRR